MISNGGKIDITICSIDYACETIIENIKEAYNKEHLDPEIETKIDHFLEILKDDLFCLIEYPYVDKVYRDSYYSYFASKHQFYFRDCIRVALFSKEIDSHYFFEKEFKEYLKETYLGFFTIRPTFPSVFGRSVMSKNALTDNNFLTITYKDNSLINGLKLEVNGFPHSSQDGESISCSETTIWSLMEYFGNRYAEYKPTLPSKIIQSLSNFTEQRLLPTRGLAVEEISFSLKHFGFGTRIYSKDFFEKDFFRTIGYYVESGIPILTTIINDKIAHAILIIGREHVNPNEVDYSNLTKHCLNYNSGDIEFIDFADIPKKYLINDDHYPPYKLIELNDPVEGHEDDRFLGATIDSIVVPFYPKIYLEAIKAKELTVGLLKEPDFGYKFNQDFILRFFLTSSRSFKNHISQVEGLENEIKGVIVDSTMPKFIWCTEIYSIDSFKEEKAIGLIIVDATEANDIDLDSLIFALYPDRVITIINNNFVTLNQSTINYRYFKNNLS